jgi:adenosylhomocysteinase
MKDGAILANAGHFDVEISLPDLGDESTQVLPLVEQYVIGDKRVNLLARGQVVNLAAAQGHPAGVMDVSFALQALSTELLVREQLEPGVQAVPSAIDAEVARLKLEALGVEIDSHTDEQQAYLHRWRS